MIDVGLLPVELDHARGAGFTMKGWDFSRAEVASAITSHRMLNPALELGINACPWACDFCFTEPLSNPVGRKRRLRHEMAIERRLALIDEAAALGARSINFVGAGEPTIDPDFFRLVERMAERAVTPIIYTEGSQRLQERNFAARLYELGATVVLKMNSLLDAEYQDAVVRGSGGKAGVPTRSYTAGRDVALATLLDVGFARETPTRLAFDTIICRQNLWEIEAIHRYARNRNIFVLFVNYLPSGRTALPSQDALTLAEQQLVFTKLAAIDEEDYGLSHAHRFPYAGGVPCTIRGLGLFVKVEGAVFDCPGETMALGHLSRESLATIWERARPITRSFDGGCRPRELAEQRLSFDVSASRLLRRRETPSTF